MKKRIFYKKVNRIKRVVLIFFILLFIMESELKVGNNVYQEKLDESEKLESHEVISGELESHEVISGEPKPYQVINGVEKPINLEIEKDPSEYKAGDIIGKEIIEKFGIQSFFYQQEITDQILARMNGKSYPKDCKVPVEDLRYLRMLYHGFDGLDHIGEMVVNLEIAQDTLSVFIELYRADYPIEKILLVDEYNGDDTASMSDNNTSAFNYRVIQGTSKLSNHSQGYAIDINPLYNPYVKEEKGELKVSPVQAGIYAEHSSDNPYFIRKGDICEQTFKRYGFQWGGDWNTKKDYQHFDRTA